MSKSLGEVLSKQQARVRNLIGMMTESTDVKTKEWTKATWKEHGRKLREAGTQQATLDVTKWRAKYHAARRYLRAANKGAEMSAKVRQLLAYQNEDLIKRLRAAQARAAQTNANADRYLVIQRLAFGEKRSDESYDLEAEPTNAEEMNRAIDRIKILMEYNDNASNHNNGANHPEKSDTVPQPEQQQSQTT